MKEWTREERYRILKDPEEIRELHERIKESPYRQTFHVQPVTGLLNDPNGFLHYNGVWHLFYQWCPWGAVHGLKYWYHVESKDLVTWKNIGTAIRPDTEYDNKGAYSGSALVTNDGLYLYYTGNHRDENWNRTPFTCIAKLDDNGTVDKAKYPLFGPQNGYTEHQRDPKIIFRRNVRKYNIIIGGQNEQHKGRCLVYESDRPDSGWYFKGELKVPGYEDFGDMWECPSIEQIDGKDVLIFCPQHITLPDRGEAKNHNGYIIGSMDWGMLTFTPDGSFHELDFGFDSYAAECAARLHQWDEGVLIAWMGLPDSSYPTDEEDWSGCLTLPRRLRVRNRRLIQTPLEELVALRDGEADPAEGILPGACEMELFNEEERLDLSLFSDSAGDGGIRISYDPTSKKIIVDRSGLTRKINTDMGNVRTRPLEHGLNHLRIFIDHSSVEIFVNDGDAVFSSRVFPAEEEHCFTCRTNARIHIWNLKPAVKDDFVV